MRQTRPVAVLLVVTAALVALVLQGAGAPVIVIALTLVLSSTPLTVVLAARRPWAREVTRATTGTGLVVGVLSGLGFVITEIVLAVGDLDRRGGTLHPADLAAAGVVAMAVLFLVLLAAGTAPAGPAVRLPGRADIGRWIRDHDGVVAAVALVTAIGVLTGIVASGTSPDPIPSVTGFTPAAAAIVDPAVEQVIAQAFPDPVLRECVSAAARTGATGRRGLSDLVRLSCPGSDAPAGAITSLQGLQYLPNLRTLSLPGNAVRELSPLMGLIWLDELDLSDNRITKVTSLTAMPRLSRLTLSRNRITDPRSLRALPALRMLNIADNRITDAAAVAGCATVDELWIGGNPLTDVSALRTMSALQGVDLEGIDPTRVTGVEVLRQRGVYVGGLA